MCIHKYIHNDFSAVYTLTQVLGITNLKDVPKLPNQLTPLNQAILTLDISRGRMNQLDRTSAFREDIQFSATMESQQSSHAAEELFGKLFAVRHNTRSSIAKCRTLQGSFFYLPKERWFSTESQVMERLLNPSVTVLIQQQESCQLVSCRPLEVLCQNLLRERT